MQEIIKKLEAIEKRLTALEKPTSKPKTTQKTTTKKELYYYDITNSKKVNQRNLKSLEKSYNYNMERYGKTFKENYKTFKDFIKVLNNLGFIKTRDRIYYSQREYDKIKGIQK